MIKCDPRAKAKCPFADSIASDDKRFLWPAETMPRPWRVHIGVDFGGNGSQHAFVATGVLQGYTGCIGLQSRRIPPKDTDVLFLQNQFIEFVEAVFARWGEVHGPQCRYHAVSQRI